MKESANRIYKLLLPDLEHVDFREFLAETADLIFQIQLFRFVTFSFPSHFFLLLFSHIISSFSNPSLNKKCPLTLLCQLAERIGTAQASEFRAGCPAFLLTLRGNIV